MKLAHIGKAGDADIFVVTLDDGSDHKFIASNVEKLVHPRGLAGVVAEKIARFVVMYG